MANIGAENILFTADPQPLEAGLDRMAADLGGFGRRAAAMEAPPAPAHMGAAAGMGRRGVLGVGEDASKVTAGFEAGIGAALRQEEEASAAARKLTAGLKDQAKTFGMTSREAEIYKLAAKGATEADLAGARTADRDLTSKERGERFKEAIFSGAAKAAGIAGGAAQDIIQRQGAGTIAGGVPKDATADAIGVVGNFAQMLPGPLGSIASTITGVIGSIVSAINAEANKMTERVGAAFGDVISGSKSARQALADVRTNVLTQDLGAMATQVTGMMQSGIGRALLARQGGVGAGIEEIVQRAERTQQLYRQMQANPQMQEVVRTTAIERGNRQAADLGSQTRDQAGQSRLQAGLLAGGSTAEEAANAAQRLGMAQTVANAIQREGESRANALARANAVLETSLRGVARAQEEARAAAATMQVGENMRAASLDIEMMGRRTTLLRDMRPIVADMTQEEQQLAVLRRQGANADILQQGARRNDDLRFAREQNIAQQQGRQLTEQTRNPLEEFDRERDRLEELRHRGAITQDVFGRGLEQASDRMMRAAGEAPVGQAAAMEGSAQAASIIARARREQERDNTPARMLRAIEELRAVAVSQRARQQELNQLIQNGRVFRAVNAP